MELISIIVPIYKVEPYLRQCLDSIIHQTYTNLEIILVDDGSPDKCGEICDEYAQSDKRIIVIHKENGGLSSARNAGLDIATGEYISFIDSDDYVHESFIEQLYNLCTKNECDIAECDFQKFEKEIIVDYNNINVQLLSPYQMQNNIYSKSYIRTVVVWNKLYKNYLYEELRFPEGKINEDEFTTYKVFYNCKTNVAVSNEKLYFYRYNSSSIMGKKFNIKRLDALEAYRERKNFYLQINENSLYEKTVKAYQEKMKEFYFLIKDTINNSNEYLNKMKCELNANLNDYMKLKNISKKEKIKMFLFSKIPKIYCFMGMIKSKTGEKI